ncbi:hypothetical protein AB1Y20_016185 [Prymnesium parvum]|uniref:Nucleotide-diphospho-sugar transferase domain-containing protein n=1 Tax=Prymnesium parvum TaxID=97485 RepID=A0AB34ICK2_PRYPA
MALLPSHPFASPVRASPAHATPAHAETAALRALVGQLSARLDSVRALTHARSNLERLAEAAEVEGAAAALPPRLASTAFTRERLLAEGGPRLVLTFTNGARLDFARSWAAHAAAVGLRGAFVGATDGEAEARLVEDGVPTFRVNASLSPREWGWGGAAFHALGPVKVGTVRQAVAWGFEVIVTDTDALVLRDPWPYVSRWADAGFLTTSDHLGNTSSDGGLETHGAIHSAFNIGYMLFRPSALPLIEAWYSSVMQNPLSRWDQGEFNSIARAGWDPLNTKGLSDPRLFWSYKQRVVGGVLPISLFCGGHSYFISQYPQRMGLRPYSIHTTYQYGGAPGKRHRLREAGVWVDAPAYYKPPGVLQYLPDLPAALVRPPGGMDTAGHIRLVDHQLKQLASAFALARLLGRVLLLPALVCGYDKYWGPLSDDGMIPGAPAFAAPIHHCPLDHMLEPAALDLEHTARESSFLQHPSLPEGFNASRAATSLNVGTNVEEARLEAARLQRFGEKVLLIRNLPQVNVLASPLLPPPLRAKVMQQLGNAGGSWCCRPRKDPPSMPQHHGFRLLDPEAVSKYEQPSYVEEKGARAMQVIRKSDFLTGPL